jgi:hypothetical protein
MQGIGGAVPHSRVQYLINVVLSLLGVCGHASKPWVHAALADASTPSVQEPSNDVLMGVCFYGSRRPDAATLQALSNDVTSPLQFQGNAKIDVRRTLNEWSKACRLGQRR